MVGSVVRIKRFRYRTENSRSARRLRDPPFSLLFENYIRDIEQYKSFISCQTLTTENLYSNNYQDHEKFNAQTISQLLFVRWDIILFKEL